MYIYTDNTGLTMLPSNNPCAMHLAYNFATRTFHVNISRYILLLRSTTTASSSFKSTNRKVSELLGFALKLYMYVYPYDNYHQYSSQFNVPIYQTLIHMLQRTKGARSRGNASCITPRMSQFSRLYSLSLQKH